MKESTNIPLIHSTYDTVRDRSIITKEIHYKDHFVPKNFDTDYTTTMWFLRWFIPRFGKANLASSIHDCYYATRYISRSYSDKAYRDVMIDCGIHPVNAYARWIGLRIVGGWWYNSKSNALKVREMYGLSLTENFDG